MVLDLKIGTHAYSMPLESEESRLRMAAAITAAR